MLGVTDHYFLEGAVTDLRNFDVISAFSRRHGRCSTTRRTTRAAVTRDYVFDLDAPARVAPLLSIFGGKLTTYRRLRSWRSFPPWRGLDETAGRFALKHAGRRSKLQVNPAMVPRGGIEPPTLRFSVACSTN